MAHGEPVQHVPPLFQEAPKVWVPERNDGPSVMPINAAQPLARVETQALATAQDSPMAVISPNPVAEVLQLIRMSIENKLDPGKLHDILKEERSLQAKGAFITAKAKFKKECPPVPKSQANPQFAAERDGVKTKSMFAPLETMQTLADPHLGANGFSYDWKEPPPGPDGERYLHFVLEHVGGHSETYPARITPPEKGGCSEPQKDGIAYEYARRQSFRNGTGIRIVGEDNDGNDPPQSDAAIDENQRRTINDLFLELKLDDAGRAAFLAIFEVKSVAEIKQVMFGPVANALNARIKGAKR